MSDWAFGYGSLAVAVPGAHRTSLTGHRRAWTVAMDNGVDLPGYKYYVDDDGARPAVHVAFLDLVAGDSTVEGLCRPVTDDDLAVLDRRERQYVRVEVTGQVLDPRGRTWAYVGRADSRDRADAARAAGTLVVARSYVDAVRAAFDAWGRDARQEFEASTDAVDVPVLDLHRVDLG